VARLESNFGMKVTAKKIENQVHEKFKMKEVREMFRNKVEKLVGFKMLWKGK